MTDYSALYAARKGQGEQQPTAPEAKPAADLGDSTYSDLYAKRAKMVSKTAPVAHTDPVAMPADGQTPAPRPTTFDKFVALKFADRAKVAGQVAAYEGKNILNSAKDLLVGTAGFGAQFAGGMVGMAGAVLRPDLPADLRAKMPAIGAAAASKPIEAAGSALNIGNQPSTVAKGFDLLNQAAKKGGDATLDATIKMVGSRFASEHPYLTALPAFVADLAVQNAPLVAGEAVRGLGKVADTIQRPNAGGGGFGPGAVNPQPPPKATLAARATEAQPWLKQGAEAHVAEAEKVVRDVQGMMKLPEGKAVGEIKPAPVKEGTPTADLPPPRPGAGDIGMARFDLAMKGLNEIVTTSASKIRTLMASFSTIPPQAKTVGDMQQMAWTADSTVRATQAVLANLDQHAHEVAKREGITGEDLEAIYHYDEDKTLPLTQRQRGFYVQVIAPLKELHVDVLKLRDKIGPDTPWEEHGTPRYAEGKRNFNSRLIAGEETAPLPGVTTKTPGDNARTMFLGRDVDSGTERVIHVGKDKTTGEKKITGWEGGEGTDLGKYTSVTAEEFVARQTARARKMVDRLQREAKILERYQGKDSRATRAFNRLAGLLKKDEIGSLPQLAKYIESLDKQGEALRTKLATLEGVRSGPGVEQLKAQLADLANDREAAGAMQNWFTDALAEETGRAPYQIGTYTADVSAPAKGYTRLYRAESPTVKFSDVFDAKQLQDFRRPQGMRGQRYSDSLKTAQYYQRSYGKDANISYVDVPTKDVSEFKVADGEYIVDLNPPPRGADGAFKQMADTLRKLGSKDKVEQAITATERAIDRLNERRKVLGLDPKEREAITRAADAVRKLQDRMRVLSQVREVYNPGSRRLAAIKGKYLPKLLESISAVESKYGNQPEGTYFKDGAGRLWERKQATTKQIEANTNVRYSKNVLANYVHRLGHEGIAAVYSQAFKAMKEAKDIGGNAVFVKQETVPAGTPRSQLRMIDSPWFHGYMADPRVANIIEDLSRNVSGEANKLQAITDAMIRPMFLIPFIHMGNIGAHYWFAKGLSGQALSLAGLPYYGVKFAQQFGKTWQKVMTMSPEYVDMLGQGAGFMHDRVMYRDFMNNFAQNFRDADPRFKTLAEDVGLFQGAGRAIAAFYEQASQGSAHLMWAFDDTLKMMHIENQEAKGVSWATAIREMNKHIPDYRVPSNIAGSRTLANMFRNVGGTIFGPYHYGILRSLIEGHKDIINGIAQRDAKLAGHGLNLMLGLWMTSAFMYPAMNLLFQVATGNPQTRLDFRGPFKLIGNVLDSFGYKKPFGDNSWRWPKSVRQIGLEFIMPNPVIYGAAEAVFNKDLFTGKEVYNDHDAASFMFWTANYAANSVMPVAEAGKMITGKKTGPEVALGFFGITSPAPAKIAKQKGQYKQHLQMEKKKEHLK